MDFHNVGGGVASPEQLQKSIEESLSHYCSVRAAWGCHGAVLRLWEMFGLGTALLMIVLIVVLACTAAMRERGALPTGWAHAHKKCFCSTNNGAAEDQGDTTVLPSLHVINLQDNRGTCRRENIRRQLNSVNISVQFSPAFDKTKVRNDDRLAPNTAENPTDYRLSAGEVALVRSHAFLYEKLLASRDEYYLIAEDDIEVHPHFVRHLRMLCRELPENFDWIKLEYGNDEASARAVPDKRRIVALGPSEVESCAALYMVSRKGAALLLAVNPPARPWRAADGAMDPKWIALAGHRQPNAFLVQPPLAWQSANPQVQRSGTHRDDA